MPQVSDGISSHYDEELDFTKEETVELSWTGFSDPCAPIERYEVVLQAPSSKDAWLARLHTRKAQVEDDTETQSKGNNGGLHSRQDLTSSGTVNPIGTDPWEWTHATTEVTLLQSSPTFTSLTVTVPAPGKYRARVCAVNVIRQRSCAYSDGFVADYTPPTEPKLCVLVPRRVPICGQGVIPQREQLALRWHGCDDPESGVGKFLWSASDPATPEATANIHAVTDAHWDGGARLSEEVTHAGGQQMMFHVTCLNGAGLESSSTAGPFVFDDTRPELEMDGTHRGGRASVLSFPEGNEVNGTVFLNSPTVGIRIGRVYDLESELTSLELRVRARGGVWLLLQQDMLNGAYDEQVRLPHSHPHL